MTPAERKAAMLAMLNETPPPGPPMPDWHCLKRATCRASEMVIDIDDEGKAIYRAPYSENEPVRD